MKHTLSANTKKKIKTIYGGIFFPETEICPNETAKLWFRVGTTIRMVVKDTIQDVKVDRFRLTGLVIPKDAEKLLIVDIEIDGAGQLTQATPGTIFKPGLTIEVDDSKNKVQIIVTNIWTAPIKPIIAAMGYVYQEQA